MANGFEGGLSNPDTVEFRRRRELLDTINSLRTLGVDLHLDLPQIAVVGSQSVGKSSLIEAISGISLPRASGTCTRCPIECNLSSSSSPWRCEISLRFTVDSRERPLTSVRNVNFGGVITVKSEVEDRIRRAQMAILNPLREPNTFLDQPVESISMKDALPFSSNCISVHITGSDVDDLSFVDLPGIIASVRDGQDESAIEQVQSLVQRHISKPSCLILLVVSCEMDLENQGARRLVKKMDPTGQRTIPVLTKPDRIPNGEEHAWLMLLRNAKERHKHGWFCVKQPSSEAMNAGVTWQEARDAEVAFFTQQTPWMQLDEFIKARLGTSPLTKALGEILFALIAKRLPELLAELTTNIKVTKDDLMRLPQRVVTDPVAEIWRLLNDFQHDVEQLVNGRPNDQSEGLLQSIRVARVRFREEVFTGAPAFKPYTKGQAVESSESYSNTDGLEPPFHAPDTTVYLDEVAERAESSITRELPHNYAYAVKVYYCQRFTKPWAAPAQDLFDIMHDLFQDHLNELVRKHFSQYAHGGLEGKVSDAVSEHLERCTSMAHERMYHCIQLEQEEPTTVNEQYLAEYKDKFLIKYRAQRKYSVGGAVSTVLGRLLNNSGYDNNSLHHAVNYLSHLGFSSVTRESLLRLLPPDVNEFALDIMAEVRAYYQVAFKRFVDYIPMIIDYELLKGFKRTVQSTLFLGLGLTASDAHQRCQDYLAESLSVKHRRDTLEAKFKTLENARLQLQKTLAMAGTAIVYSDDDPPRSNSPSSDNGTLGYTGSYSLLSQPQTVPAASTTVTNNHGGGKGKKKGKKGAAARPQSQPVVPPSPRAPDDSELFAEFCE